MPVPPKTNITHYRGDSLVVQVAVWQDAGRTEPADLSGALVRGQVREQYDAAAVAASFDVDVAGNIITANLSPASSRATPPKGVWDIEVDWFSDDTFVQTVAGGAWVTSPDVTRDGVVA